MPPSRHVVDEYSEPDDPQNSEADWFTRMLHYRDRFVPLRRNSRARPGPSVRSSKLALERLSAILRSRASASRNADVRHSGAGVSPGKTGRRKAKHSRKFAGEEWARLEFKSSDSVSGRSIPDYCRLIRLRRCSIMSDSIRAITADSGRQSSCAKSRNARSRVVIIVVVIISRVSAREKLNALFYRFHLIFRIAGT